MNSIELGIVVWVLSAGATYLFLRKALYGVFDPVAIAAVAIPFSAALLAVLCQSGLATWDKFQLFCLVLAGYLVGARVSSCFFSWSNVKHSMLATIVRVPKAELQIILLIAALCTLAVGTLGVAAGGGGDGRQEFSRIFRPIVLIQNGLFFIALIALLSPRLKKVQTYLWLAALVIFSIPFSGKGVFIPVLYWYGLKIFLSEGQLTLRGGLKVLGLVFVGLGLMAIFAYGSDSFFSIFLLATNRIWMSGDVYMYAYGADALAALRSYYHVDFTSYMLHPLTSLIGIRGYDKPLGSMLASEYTGENVFTGPNPQLPIVADYFFPSDLAASACIGVLTAILVFGLRGMCIQLPKSRSTYLGLGAIAAGIFAPIAGFLDTSQVIISCVSIGTATALSVALEMLFRSRSSRHRAHPPTLLARNDASAQL